METDRFEGPDIEPRLDLSALAPAPDRWRAVMDGALARADAALAERARRHDPLALIAGWRRPLLAAAAAALLLLVPVEMALEAREDRAERVRGLVSLTTAWASGAQAPTGADLLRAVGAGEPR